VSPDFANKDFMVMPATGSESLSASSISQKRSPLLLIFMTILIDMIGFGIVIPVLPIYAQHFHASPWQIGILFGTFSLMQFIFAPLMGRWSDKVGRRPVLLLSVVGTAISFLVLGFANTLPMLFLGRMIDGISGANVSTAQAYIADVTPPEKRSAAMGLLGAAFGLGFVFGPALGGLLGHYSITLPFFVAAGMALINSVAIFLFLPESLSIEKRQLGRVDALSFSQSVQQAFQKPLRNVMGCALLSTMAFSLVTALFTLFTQNRLHWGPRENGLLFAGVGGIGVLVQGGLIRRLVPKLGEKPLIVAGCFLLLTSMIILPLPWMHNPLLPVITGAVLLAFGNSLLTPMLSGLTSKLSTAASQGSMLGMLQSVSSFARMVGPAIGGFLLSQDEKLNFWPYGMSPFWFAAVLILMGLLFAMKLINTHKQPHQP
jgi:MFS transporter, DHA1 family, tetracycline resistance protein